MGAGGGGEGVVGWEKSGYFLGYWPLAGITDFLT